MQELLTASFFFKDPGHRLNRPSVAVFVVAASIAWGVNVLGRIVFPSRNWLPYTACTTVTLAMDVFLLVVSVQLLKKNQIPAKALGLSLSRNNFLNLLLGILIGAGALTLIQALLYAIAPFHFARGTLHLVDVLKESYSYLVGNSLEELMFRGFLLLVLSRFAGWRVAVVSTALLFGLFHLQGSQMNMAALELVASTAIYSFIFSLSYIVTQSLWTAIAAHATSNILLHAVLGLDGMNRALLVPVSSGSTHVSGFWALILAALAVSCLLYMAVSHKLRNAVKSAAV